MLSVSDTSHGFPVLTSSMFSIDGVISALWLRQINRTGIGGFPLWLHKPSLTEGPTASTLWIE